MAKVKKQGSTFARNGRLSRQQEKFIQYIIQGDTQIDAYYKAYPKKRNIKRTSAGVMACNLFNKPIIQKYYAEAVEKARKLEQESAMWTREQAIKTLRTVVNSNLEEMSRIDDAANEEIKTLEELLMTTMDTDPEQAKTVLAALIKAKKQRRRTAVHNDGITKAVAELNKMQGFNEETINMNGTVIFAGEEELED